MKNDGGRGSPGFLPDALPATGQLTPDTKK